MIAPVATAGLAFATSLAVTPLVRRLAHLCGATDVPDARRVHTQVTARAGGVGVLFAAALALALGGGLPALLGPSVLAGAALLLVIGLIDDIVSLRAQTKLLGQVIAAGLAVYGGLRFQLFGAGATGPLAALDAVATGTWVVLITNAFNLTDGLDGLASGIATFSFLALAAVGLQAHDPTLVAVALVLAGALLGFLPYNFNPASIFLGDTGSLVLGYALAVLPLVGTKGQPLPLEDVVSDGGGGTVHSESLANSRSLPEWGGHVLMRLTVIAAGVLIFPLAWAYVRFKQGIPPGV